MKSSIRQIIKMTAQNVYLPLVYRLYAAKKADPARIVFADAHHNTRPSNMQPLISHLIKDNENGAGWKITEHYLDYGTASPVSVMRHMTRFMKLYAGAGTVVLCDNFLPAAGCAKRPETKVVQLWHACGALKKFGYATTDDIPAGYKGNVFRNTDLVTVSAPFCVQPFAEAMRLDTSCVRPLGVSRTDRYFSGKWKERARKHFLEAHPEAEGKHVVVWAPTFRGSAADPVCISLDTDRLQKDLGDDWIVLAKLHPHMKEINRLFPDSNGPGRITQLPVEELYEAADIMIADYSSLIYEYLLFGKPLVLYVPDLEVYSRKRGFFMPYDEIPARQVLEEDKLKDAVMLAWENRDDPQTVGKIRQFTDTYMSACDGKSTGRIAQWIAGQQS